MSELISRQKLIEEIKKESELHSGGLYEDEILDIIESQPPASQCVFDYERVISTLDARYDLAYELYKGTCSEYQAGRMEAYDTAVRIIEEYSNGEPADQWIPCSEKNPSEPGYYEVTVNDGMGCRIRTMARYDITIKDWVTSTIHDDEVVVAWRERLSEPYMGVE